MPMSNPSFSELRVELAQVRTGRAGIIAGAGGFSAARSSGALPQHIDISVSEALVLGLLLQGVSTFVTVFGHGSTEIGEVLRIYQQAYTARLIAARIATRASGLLSSMPTMARTAPVARIA